MAFHHHHHHQNHHSTTQSCCCQTSPCHSHHTPPPLSPPPSSSFSSSDPFLIATIVSQLLQPQTPHNYISKPTSINPNLRYPSQETHHFHPHSSSFLFSLLHRIDNLETSLSHLSSSSSSSCSYPPYYLKDAAARVIQTHFRVFLVRRSRTLRQLKELANVKSTLTRLKSSFSLHDFVDYDSISHKAMDLLLLLDSVQGEDKMIRDSKKSITREIIQFLEMIDGVCVKRHQVMTRKIKSMRLVRNDKARSGHISKGYSERAEGSKGRNVDNEEKKLIEILRERVERIGKMSRALVAEEVADDESQGFEHLGDEDGATFNHIRSKYGLNNGVTINKSVPFSNGKKRVCLVEDGTTIRVYNVDGDKIIAARDVDEIEDSTKGRQDEEEAQSDGDQSSQSSEEVRSNRSYEVDRNQTHDKEFTFSAPQPLQMEPRADFLARKRGVNC